MLNPTDESQVQQLIQLEGPKQGCILFRNNSGALKDATGRLVRYGLGNETKARSETFKSSDLIGITSVVVTQEMVGKVVAVFTAIEVKHPKWKPSDTTREKGQQNFINWVLSKGGMAGFANSVDKFKEIIAR
jgi:hypothetical protein